MNETTKNSRFHGIQLQANITYLLFPFVNITFKSQSRNPRGTLLIPTPFLNRSLSLSPFVSLSLFFSNRNNIKQTFLISMMITMIITVITRCTKKVLWAPFYHSPNHHSSIGVNPLRHVTKDPP